MLYPASLQLALFYSTCKQQCWCGTSAGKSLCPTFPSCPPDAAKAKAAPTPSACKVKWPLWDALLCWMICTRSLWDFCCIFSHAGGEGGVLAAACSVIGVGSDIGGSIRMPAFFNGVFGHKPTTGKAGVGISSPPQQKCQEVGRWGVEGTCSGHSCVPL